MQIFSIAGSGFERVPNGMAKIENRAEAGFGFILTDDIGLDFTIALKEFWHLPFQPLEKANIVDDAIFNHFGQTSPEFSIRQSLQGVQVANYELRLMKCAHEILARFEIHPHLAANGTIHLGQQRCRDLDEGNSAQVCGRDETRKIAYDASAERYDERFSFQAVRRKLVVAL